ncbi:MAG: hypothetical protein ACJARR_000086 [Pseudophaeobacter arcticus]|jgi:hypothetical protein
MHGETAFMSGVSRPRSAYVLVKGEVSNRSGHKTMTTVEFLPNTTAAAKAEAALQDLEQAWAYYTPEALHPSQDNAPTEGFVPYYDAA